MKLQKKILFVLFIVSFSGSHSYCANTVDLLIVITGNARFALNGDPDTTIGEEVNAWVNTVNAAHLVSNTNTEFNLVHIFQTDIQEEGCHLLEVFGALRSDMEIKNIRDQYGADVVVLIVDQLSEDNCRGLSVLGASDLYTSYALVDFSNLSGFSLTHETGHIFGCNHPQQETGKSQVGRGYGYKFDGVSPEFRFYTVMATCNSDAFNWNDSIHTILGTRLNRFSSPNQEWNGFTLGVVSRNDSASFIRDLRGAAVASFNPNRPIWIWMDTFVEADDWRRSDWFGWLEVGSHPWDFSFDHGWIYALTEDCDEFWYWDAELGGTVYTSRNLYPWIYRSADGHWLRYVEGTHSPRIFWNYTLDQQEFCNAS